MILKLFKIPIFITINALVYFLLYNYYVEANYIYISNDILNDTSKKYVNLIYWLNIKSEKTFFNKVNKDIFNKFDNTFSTINHNLTLYIEKLWIKESMFILDYIKNKDEYLTLSEKKRDKDLIDLEVVNIDDLRSWFLIWGHSSWYLTDKSPYKNIFNSLQFLDIWDELKILRDDWIEIKFKVKTRQILNLKDTIKINWFYIFTCYPTWSNSHRLVLELELIK